MERVSVQFPVALLAASLTNDHFEVRVGSEAIPGELQYEAISKTLFFIPNEPLPPLRLHTVTLSGEVRFEGGRRLAAPVIWSFTTAAARVIDPPDSEGPDGGTPGGEDPSDEAPGTEEPGDEGPGDQNPGGEAPGGEEPGGDPDAGDPPGAEPQTVTFEVRNSVSEYDGTSKTLTVISDPPEVPYTITYLLGGTAVDDPIDAGTYQANVEAADNDYVGATQGELIITPRPLTIRAHEAIKSVGEEDPPLTYTLTGNLALGDSITGSLQRGDGEAIGAYRIEQGTLSAGPNYEITFHEAVLEIASFGPELAIRTALGLMQGDMSREIATIASRAANLGGPWAFGLRGPDPDQPAPSSVAQALDRVASAAQMRADDFTCGSNFAEDGTPIRIRLYMTATACSEALPHGVTLELGRLVSGRPRENGGNQRYALPFAIVIDGTHGGFTRRVILHGEYQFDVGRRSFARYLLLTDVQLNGSGEPVWFASTSLFDGPVHTNGVFYFSGQPWFGGPASSAGQRFRQRTGAYGAGTPERFFTAAELEPQGNEPDMSNGSGQSTRPQLTGGVDWRAEPIDLPTGAYAQRLLAAEHGILLTNEVYSLELFAADTSGRPIAVNASPSAAYQYVRAVTRDSTSQNMETITYRVSPSGRLEQHDANGTWSVLTEQFNGVIYSDRPVTRLRGPGRLDPEDPETALPAVASFAQLTIVSARGARITSDLIYEDPPCTGSLRREDPEIIRAICDNLQAQNILGIFAPTDNILIGFDPNQAQQLSAPNDVRIHASLLASDGEVRVEQYSRRAPSGAVQLLGGIISKMYGAFGEFRRESGMLTSGYERQFTFDPRMGAGYAPPHFPDLPTDDITDVQTEFVCLWLPVC